MADDDKKLEHINVKVTGQVIYSNFLLFYYFYFRIIMKFILKLSVPLL